MREYGPGQVTRFPERWADIPQHVTGVLTWIERALYLPEVCSACGCLCRPFETCPSCRVAARERRNAR